ncbi:MAG: DUF4433 domain-containing protein [Candidatus Omnitrophica bacterium]|nr:DUF4433 domain-containing protein [Candidatus Omnitrophota bacterium]
MDKNDIKELYFITDLVNVPSIMKDGILSHKRAQKIQHSSIALEDVQNRREDKKIPGTKKELHDYANVYFDAHNPMLSRVRHKNNSICVLRIKKDILDITNVIVTDQNASRDCWFKPVDEGLSLLKAEEVFATWWTNSEDYFEEYRLKGVKCAEVLVPDLIQPSYIFGAYVANNKAKEEFEKVTSLPVKINGTMFFQ